MNKVILIGGAPTAGKSYTARKIAEELRLPWISTDAIGDFMRNIADKKKFSKIFYFYSKGVTAEKYLGTHTPQQVVEDQNSESEEVWQGVETIIRTNFLWKNFIIEGVAVLPKLVKTLAVSKYDIKPIFLVDKNEDRIRKVVYTRGLWGDAKSYSDNVKEVEVEWVKLFNDYIIAEAKKYEYSVYNIDDQGEFIQNLTQEIKEWLEK